MKLHSAPWVSSHTEHYPFFTLVADGVLRPDEVDPDDIEDEDDDL